MSNYLEPPETHPVRVVEVEPDRGPKFTIQAQSFESGAYVDVGVSVRGQGECEVALSLRCGLPVADVDRLIDALTAARDEALREAALYG